MFSILIHNRSLIHSNNLKQPIIIVSLNIILPIIVSINYKTIKILLIKVRSNLILSTNKIMILLLKSKIH